MSDHLVRRKQNKKLSQTFLHDMSPAALSFSEEWIFIFTGRDRKEGNPCQKEIVFRPTFTKAGIPAWRWAYFIRPAIKAHSSVDFVSSPGFGWIWLAWILGRPTSSSIEIILFWVKVKIPKKSRFLSTTLEYNPLLHTIHNFEVKLNTLLHR